MTAPAAVGWAASLGLVKVAGTLRAVLRTRLAKVSGNPSVAALIGDSSAISTAIQVVRS